MLSEIVCKPGKLLNLSKITQILSKFELISTPSVNLLFLLNKIMLAVQSYLMLEYLYLESIVIKITKNI